MNPNNIDLDSLKLHFKTTKHKTHPSVITQISVKVKHAKFGQLANLEAWRIVRDSCYGRFLRIMDEENNELHKFSLTLFDRYGEVRRHLIEGGHRSGTGCWGTELNSGELVYILDIAVKAPYTNMGVGSWLLERFKSSNHVKIDDTVVCWPTPAAPPMPFPDADEEDDWESTRKRQINFFRKSHFRRIGRTNFFGYSRKPQHPSRSIAPEADVGALNEGFPRPPIFPFMDRESKFPLHYAIHQDKTPNIVTIIQHLYARDPTIIHKPDDMGFTPIFMAAGSGNLLAARKLLEWDLRAELESHANAEGATPLETLFDEMTTIREIAETYNKRWDGHCDERLTVQYLLKQAMGLSVGSLKEYIKANKYGCTCNKCAGGWLSPRMRSRLINDVEFWADMMPDSFDSFPQGEKITLPGANLAITRSCSTAPPTISIPPALYPHFDLDFFKGHTAVYCAIYKLLSTTQDVLSAASVLTFLPANANKQAFFRKGGRVEFAFAGITDGAEEESPLVEPSFDEEDEEWKALPACRNDLEFQLVRRMLGLEGTIGTKPAPQWGPYLAGAEN